ncbi:MAG TPA: STAS domain-containing protein [Bryobacteraceae bacterium]|nr:STAS domain-containing protein [Bryobacteraceae bacterium]
MLIELEQKDDIVIVRFQGRIATGADSEYLGTKLEEVRNRRSDKVLADFREVTSIGSTGIGFVVAVYTSVTKMPGGRFVLMGANSRVREVLELTSLSTIIPLADDMKSGLAVLQQPNSAGGAAGLGGAGQRL